MSHGFESSKDGAKWLALAPKFYDAGFASFRFSYRGCGEGVEKSEGRFEDTTLSGRIWDYKAALDYIETTGVAKDRIGVVGSSFGGVIAIAARDDRVKAMVLLATPSHFPLWQQLSDLRENFHRELQKYDIPEDIRRIRCPILIIHGDSDDVVPLKDAYKLYEKANEPKKLKMIEGGSHIFDNPEHLEEIVNLSLEWFKRYL
jgi:alpha/beta superfamily hydrolase